MTEAVPVSGDRSLDGVREGGSAQRCSEGAGRGGGKSWQLSSGGGRGRGWAEDLEPVPGGKHLILKSKLHACSPILF